MQISIIIPCYNQEFELNNLLKSLDQQDFTDFEVIVINDGGEEIDEKTIKSEHEYKIKYCYCERSEKSGRSYARNKGILQAEGDIIIFLDADQIVRNDFVRNHYEFMVQKGNVVQFGTRKQLLQKVIVGHNDINKIEVDEDPRHQIFSKIDYELDSLSGLWHLVYTHNLSILKKNIVEFGGFDEDFKGWGLEDTEFAYRMKKHRIPICYNPSVETYNQFDEQFELIDDEQRKLEWLHNFYVFANKYNDAEVWCQSIFENNIDVSRKNTFQEKGIKSVWVFCFFQFENMLKELEKYDSKK